MWIRSFAAGSTGSTGSRSRQSRLHPASGLVRSTTMSREAAAAVSVAVAIALAAIGTFRGDDDNAMRQFMVVCAIILIVAAIVFWVIVPRIDRLGRGSLILAIVGVISVVVFWTGVPPVLAGGAALLATRARERGVETGMTTAALVLAALTVAAAAVVAFVG
jgi:hypothetical protein